MNEHEQVTISYGQSEKYAPEYRWVAYIKSGKFSATGYGETRKQARKIAILNALAGHINEDGSISPILPPNYDVSKLKADEIDEPEPEPRNTTDDELASACDYQGELEHKMSTNTTEQKTNTAEIASFQLDQSTPLTKEKVYNIAAKLGTTNISYDSGKHADLNRPVAIAYDKRPECAPTHTWMATVTSGRYEVFGWGGTRKAARERAIENALRGFTIKDGTTVPVLPPNYDVSRLSDDEIDEVQQPRRTEKRKERAWKVTENPRKLITVIALVVFSAIIFLHYNNPFHVLPEFWQWYFGVNVKYLIKDFFCQHATLHFWWDGLQPIRMPLFVLAMFYVGLAYLFAGKQRHNEAQLKSAIDKVTQPLTQRDHLQVANQVEIKTSYQILENGKYCITVRQGRFYVYGYGNTLWEAERSAVMRGKKPFLMKDGTWVTMFRGSKWERLLAAVEKSIQKEKARREISGDAPWRNS
jgi:hypothetical protein